jgi:hypothetical protein
MMTTASQQLPLQQSTRPRKAQARVHAGRQRKRKGGLIMSHNNSAQDPLDFVRGMWSNMGFNLPGMVTPTLDVDELDKRIADLKAVEGWLKMNLNMLQMTTQGLEMQRAALAAVKAMSQQAQDSAGQDSSGDSNPFANAAAMWPWNLMSGTGTESEGATAQPAAAPAKPRATTRKSSAPKK